MISGRVRWRQGGDYLATRQVISGHLRKRPPGPSCVQQTLKSSPSASGQTGRASACPAAARSTSGGLQFPKAAINYRAIPAILIISRTRSSTGLDIFPLHFSVHRRPQRRPPPHARACTSKTLERHNARATRPPLAHGAREEPARARGRGEAGVPPTDGSRRRHRNSLLRWCLSFGRRIFRTRRHRGERPRRRPNNATPDGESAP